MVENDPRVAARRSAERFADALRDDLLDRVTQELNVSREFLESTDRVRTGIQYGPGGDMKLHVEVSENRMSLKRFDPVQNEVGVRYEIEPGEVEMAEGAFIAPELGDHVYRSEGEFADTGHLQDETIYRLEPDLPISANVIKLHGPSAAEALRQADRMPSGRESAQRFAQFMAQEVNGEIELDG